MGKRQTQNKQVCLHCTLQRQRMHGELQREPVRHTHTEADSETDSERDTNQRKDKHKSAKSRVSMWLMKDICLLSVLSAEEGLFLHDTSPLSLFPSSKSAWNGPGCWHQKSGNATEYGKHWFSISEEELEQTQLTHVIMLRERYYAVCVCLFRFFFLLAYVSVCAICKDSALPFVTVQTELFTIQYRTISKPRSSH